MKLTIDRDLISDQMNTLGLSERAIIATTGIPMATFREARISGRLNAATSLRHVYRLCETLGITVGDLLTTPDADDPAGSTVQSADSTDTGEDPAHLIPLLIETKKQIAFEDLTRALGWDRTRTRAALDAIPARLSGTGLRLHESNNRFKVVPVTKGDRDIKQALGRLRATRNGLNAHEAQVLARIMDGHNVLDRSPSNATRVSVGALRNMGCIELNDAATYQPTEQLEWALPDLQARRSAVGLGTESGRRGHP